MEGTLTGLVQRDDLPQRCRARRRAPAELIEEYGGIEALGGDHTAPHFAAAWAPRRTTPRSSGASRWPATWAARATRWSSPGRADQGRRRRCGRSSRTASTSARPSSRPPGSPSPSTVDGIEQEPMDGTSFLYTFDDAGAEERHTVQYFEMFGSRAIYKDGWWACAELDKAPWDFSPETIERFAPGCRTTPTQRRRGSSTTCPTTSPRPTTWPRSSPRSWRSSRSCSGRRRSATACCRCSAAVALLRHPAAAADGHPVHVRRRRPERAARHGPAHLGPLLRDRGGAAGAGRRRRGRARRERRLHRRVRALGRRSGPAAPHLLVPRGRDLQAGLHREDPDRRRHREDAVRGRRAQAGHRRHGDALGRTTSRSARAGCRRTVPVTFSSYAGMDIGRDNGLVVDLDYEDKAPVRLHGNGQAGRLRPQARGARGRAGAARARRTRPASPTGSAPERPEATERHEAAHDESSRKGLVRWGAGGAQTYPTPSPLESLEVEGPTLALCNRRSQPTGRSPGSTIILFG